MSAQDVLDKLRARKGPGRPKSKIDDDGNITIDQDQLGQSIERLAKGKRKKTIEELVRDYDRSMKGL